MQYAFNTQHTIAFHETDMAGIAYFAHFFTWMGKTQYELLKNIGEQPAHLQNDGTFHGWPKISAHCDYLSPITIDNTLHIHTLIHTLTQHTLTLAIGFHHNNTLIAKGRLTSAHGTQKNGTLHTTPLPPNITQQLTTAPPTLLKKYALRPL